MWQLFKDGLMSCDMLRNEIRRTYDDIAKGFVAKLSASASLYANGFAIHVGPCMNAPTYQGFDGVLPLWLW